MYNNKATCLNCMNYILHYYTFKSVLTVCSNKINWRKKLCFVFLEAHMSVNSPSQTLKRKIFCKTLWAASEPERTLIYLQLLKWNVRKKFSLYHVSRDTKIFCHCIVVYNSYIHVPTRQHRMARFIWII